MERGHLGYGEDLARAAARARERICRGHYRGENGVDTKASDQLPRATLTIRNTTAWGFQSLGLIGNMAAFNLKENISATLDRVTVFDSGVRPLPPGITPRSFGRA